MANVAKKITFDPHTQSLGANGWVPAIPEPWFRFFGVQCDCGERFRNKTAYRGHYALVHVLGLD